MPESAKRFYLCNLIPLWEIDEENMDVDWPVYHAYFGDLVDMRADIKERMIHYREDGPDDTVSTHLRIRFEIYESDYLLSGGLNDHMATYSSHADYGDDVTETRPLRLTTDFESIPDAEKTQFIWIKWTNAHEITVEATAPDGTTSSSTRNVPNSLEVRCWWEVEEEEGGDVSGNPEYYYDIFVEGRLINEDGSLGDEFDLEERSDHEMEAFHWNVTDKKRPGNVEPMVDGEYVFIKMLQVMDSAQHSIHILNWKMDHITNLVLHHEYQADYAQIPGLSAAEYDQLMRRYKPEVRSVSAIAGFAAYTLSNGNVVGTDGYDMGPMAIQLDHPTNLDQPVGIYVINQGAVLIVDQLRSRILLYALFQEAALRAVGSHEGVYLLPVASSRAFQVLELRPSMTAPGHKPALLNLCGSGNPWDGSGNPEGGMRQITNQQGQPTGLYTSTAQFNYPTDLCLAHNAIFVTDTGSHRIRKIDGFNPADLGTTLGTSSLDTSTLCGSAGAGDADGTASEAQFRNPACIVYDPTSDRLLVADSGNQKIKSIDPANGETTTLAIASIDGTAGAPLGEVYGVAVNTGEGPNGTLYISEKDKHRILKVDLNTLAAETMTGSTTGQAGFADGDFSDARFDKPMGISYADSILWVADANNHVVRKVELIWDMVSTVGEQSDATALDMPIMLADVLRRKAEQGVDVRILIDDYGGGFARQAASPIRPISISAEQVGMDYRHLNSTIKCYKQNSVQTAGDRGLNSFHEKMMVVDGQHGFAGGIDFDDDKNDGMQHDRQHRVSLFWHDVTAYVQGKAALGLEETFVLRWNMARAEFQDRDDPPADIPEALSVQDRTDETITSMEAETVRTFDPSPVYGFLVNLISDETKEILESYKRAIKAARYYIYMEHQYIYYPEIGEMIVEAMREHPQLQVIWVIPFFTEETKDPTQERAQLVQGDRLLTNVAQFASNMDATQMRSQLAWHGFFRHREMVDQFREIDASRFGEFSIRKLMFNVDPITGTPIPNSQMIYPHSKMILVDDRFFSIGSANANGRGFTKDGELNISALSPEKGRELRIRLWGEHLGFVGFGAVQSDGSVFAVNGHHFSPASEIKISHPDLGGEVTRTVSAVDPATGHIILDTPLAPSLERVYWTDPRIESMRLDEALAFWRHAGHPLSVYEKVQDSHATTDESGNLVVNDHLAQVGDYVSFGQRTLLLDDEGRPLESQSQQESADRFRTLIAAQMEVSSIDTNTITLSPKTQQLPETHPVVDGRVDHEVFDLHPFRLEIMGRSSGVVDLRVNGLVPNQTEVSFDYHASWLARQEAGKKYVRTWEINPPEGIEYNGPGSVLFNPWMNALLLGLPWMFFDVDPDEQANLARPTDSGVRLA